MLQEAEKEAEKGNPNVQEGQEMTVHGNQEPKMVRKVKKVTQPHNLRQCRR